MSFSPERFLLLLEGCIQTRPIKGTLPRLAYKNADRQQVMPLTASFAIETLVTVHHMVSTITANLAANRTTCDLLRSCFSGGSITGAPKLPAMEIIDSLEPQRRSACCGSMGYVSCCGMMDTNIAIRTIIVANKRIHCPAGGWLIVDSNEQE